MTAEAVELSPNFVVEQGRHYSEFALNNTRTGVYLGRDKTVIVNKQQARSAGIQIGLVDSEGETVWDPKRKDNPSAMGPITVYVLGGGQQLSIRLRKRVWSWEKLRLVPKTTMAVLIAPLEEPGRYHYHLIVEDGLHKPA